jgi:hypothetical protein
VLCQAEILPPIFIVKNRLAAPALDQLCIPQPDDLANVTPNSQMAVLRPKILRQIKLMADRF